jgi:hypothetical protein
VDNVNSNLTLLFSQNDQGDVDDDGDCWFDAVESFSNDVMLPTECRAEDEKEILSEPLESSESISEGGSRPDPVGVIQGAIEQPLHQVMVTISPELLRANRTIEVVVRILTVTQQHWVASSLRMSILYHQQQFPSVHVITKNQITEQNQ